MTIRYLFVLTTLGLFALPGCDSADNSNRDDLIGIDSIGGLCSRDTLQKWSKWAMRTDDGLWENAAGHDVRLRLICTYGGEDMMDLPFYKADAIHLAGDTLFVSDQAQEALICMDLDGSVLWRYGEEGEGPSHFAYIGFLDTGSDWIAVCDTYGECVEILNRSGELQTIIPVSNPLDVIALSDSTIAILSKAEQGGDVHIYMLPDSLMFSFGRPSWTHYGTRSNIDLSGLLLGDSIVVMSRFCNQAFFFDMSTRTVSEDFARNYPTEYQTTHDGMAWTVTGQPFLGPESTLCVSLPAFNSMGEFRVSHTPFEEYAPVTIVDRYNLQGNYLDSFCIPIPGGGDCFYSQEYGLFVRQYATGTIYRFEVI